jgi:dienelactone hydrolase
MIRAVLAAVMLAALTLASGPAVLRAQDEPAPPRLFTASELPRLIRGVAMPPGEYTLKVWAPSGQKWSLEMHDGTPTLGVRVEKAGGRPGWQTPGVIAAREGEPVRIDVAGLLTALAGPASERHESALDSRPRAVVPALVLLTRRPDHDAGEALDVLRGRLDSVEPPDDPRREHVRTLRDRTHFQAPASDREWRDRARNLREQLLVTLGLWPMPPRTPLNPRVFGKAERDGYTIEKVVLETLPGFYLAGNLYRPIEGAGRHPIVLCPHGHWPEGRVNPDLQMRCIRWAKLGCIVFLYDMVGYADSKPFGHAFLNPRLDRWGMSLATLQTWDSIRALDWLTSLPDADPTHVGCTGESGGGTQTYLLTAIDERITVSAPIVMVSDSFQGGCVCENAAGLRIGTDNVEIAALCAPRPLKLVGATGDWTAKTLTNAYPAIRGVYELVGQPGRVSADVFDFPHNYNQTSRNAVYAFMAPWLLGPMDPTTTREGDQAAEKPADLYAFNDANPAPENRKAAAQIENDLIELRQLQIAELAPSEDGARWQAARQYLSAALRVRVGVVTPPPLDIEAAQLRRVERSDFAITHFEVGRKSTGEHVTVVRLTPTRPTDQLTVLFSPHGKAALVDADGKPVPLVKALLDRGQSVVGIDPLLVGEHADPSAFSDRRPDTSHYETYNKVLAADRLQDLATVLSWARMQPAVRTVSLVGQGRWGALVLLARPQLEGVARVAVNLHEFDYGDGEIPLDLDLPGVLQFGGLPAAAALSAPAPLWIFRCSSDRVADWARRSYDLRDAGSQLRLSEGTPPTEDLARWLASGD